MLRGQEFTFIAGRERRGKGSRLSQLEVDFLSLPTLHLEHFALDELGTPLARLPASRRAAFAEAVRHDGAFTVDLPAPWERVIQEMIPRAHGVARRYLNREGEFKEDLAVRFNNGTPAPHGPVWPADRTRSEDPDEFQPQRGIFVRLEKLWEVYQDPGLVLGFLVKHFVRTQALCRLLEVLEIPPRSWERATGGALDGGWNEVAAARRLEFDELLAQGEAAAGGEAERTFAEGVRARCRAYESEFQGWCWSSLNFYLFDRGRELERVAIRPVVDRQGERGYAATLLHEHSDYDLVASVVNNMTGLQARDREGLWHRVEPGRLLLNVGKAMQLLAGDRYEEGRIVGEAMRALPHRVVLQGPTREAVRRQLEAVRRRISIVGVTEPHGERATLLSWDRERRRLYPVAGLEHCKFWQFLTRRIPEPEEAGDASRA